MRADSGHAFAKDRRLSGNVEGVRGTITRALLREIERRIAATGTAE
ncbi:MAG: hypothetical protein ACYDEV_03715 [Acidiferrobacter sp.]